MQPSEEGKAWVIHGPLQLRKHVTPNVANRDDRIVLKTMLLRLGRPVSRTIHQETTEVGNGAGINICGAR
jgi:hypothetical protein